MRRRETVSRAWDYVHIWTWREYVLSVIRSISKSNRNLPSSQLYFTVYLENMTCFYANAINRNLLKWNTLSKITWTAIKSTYVGNRKFSLMKHRRVKRTSRITDAYSKAILIISTSKIKNLTPIYWLKLFEFKTRIYSCFVFSTIPSLETFKPSINVYANGRMKVDQLISCGIRWF